MGLSKKLGNAIGQRAPQSECLAVEYKWSTQSYTIQDILRKFKLPCVVQCATDECTVVWSKFQFDLRFPLLLYSKRTVRKVHARNLTTSTKEEFGPPVAIPEDYEGWFGASPKGVNQSKRHTRIEGIANSNTLRFLICTQCPAFTRSNGPNGSLDFVSRDIVPGETFKRVCVMEGDPIDPDTPEIVRLYGPCLECLDEKDDDIQIPLSRRAIAYEISDFYPDADHKVFNIKSIISAGNSNLPRIVSTVHGERPVLDYAYTGMLRCYSVFTEETVLAAAMDDTSPMCLELTTDSTVRFRLSLNEAFIKRTCEYNNALQLCKNSSETFLTGIKVSFSVQPEMTVNDTSVCEIQSTSDIQEVDANSEFEIAWTSGQNTVRSNFKSDTIIKGQEHVSDNFILTSSDSVDGTRSRNRLKHNSGNSDIQNGIEDLPSPPIDFTEQEIVDLMVRKGMIQRLGTSSSSDLNLTEEIETLRKTRGTKLNPIYFCNELTTQSDLEKNKEEKNDGVTNEDNDGNNLMDLDENGTSDIVDVSLDESEYMTAVCTKASEYDDNGIESDEDSDVDADAVRCDDAKEDGSVVNDVQLKNGDVNDVQIENGDLNYIQFENDDMNDVRIENGDVNDVRIENDEHMTIHASAFNDVQDESDSAKMEPNVFYDFHSKNDDAIIQKNVNDVQSDHDDTTLQPSVANNSPNENDDTTPPNRLKHLLDGSSNNVTDDYAGYSDEVRILSVETSELSTDTVSVENDSPSGLNASYKATSSDSINRKKHSDHNGKGGKTQILHKFRSETNISKIFERFKGNENENPKSSKTKIFQLKNSKKAKSKDSKPFTVHMDDIDGLEC